MVQTGVWLDTANPQRRQLIRERRKKLQTIIGEQFKGNGFRIKPTRVPKIPKDISFTHFSPQLQINGVGKPSKDSKRSAVELPTLSGTIANKLV